MRMSQDEQLGDAAVLVDATDANLLAAVIARVPGDMSLRSELIQRGRTRASGFHCRDYV